MSVFTEDAGRLLNSHETESMTGAYRDRKVAAGIGKDDYVRSEYFGLHQVQHLLSQPGCVGLRIHHAKRWEDSEGNPTGPNEGHLVPRVLLTGVNAAGKDIASRPAAYAGLKDDGDGEVQTVGDGLPCPRHCANN